MTQVGGPAETSAAYPGAFLFPKAYPKPTVTLEDTSGNPYDIATDTQGHVTLVYFGYTHCPDLCPLNMFTAATAIGRLSAAGSRPGRRRVRDDRPRRTHRASSARGLTTSIPPSSGSPDRLRRSGRGRPSGIPLAFAEHTTGVGGSYKVLHAGYVLAYTQDGLAHMEFPAEITPSQEAADLASLLHHGWPR